MKSTDYGQYHTPYPKIVLISDGLFNDCSQETEKSAQPCQKVGIVELGLVSRLMSLDFVNNAFHLCYCRLMTCSVQF